MTRSYYEKNRSRIIRKAVERQKNNPRYKAYQKTYQRWYSRNRRKRDLAFRLKYYMRIRLRKAIKGKKSDHTMSIVGCSPRELMIYLQSKFKPGMAWNNYGINGWHIDHVIPCRMFNLLDPEQQRRCFHYTNLQPLWGNENLTKDKVFSEKIDKSAVVF
jgi:Prasinovirus endonuclease VII